MTLIGIDLFAHSGPLSALELTCRLCHPFYRSFVDQDTDRYVLEYHFTPLRRKLETLKNSGMQYTDAV